MKMLRAAALTLWFPAPLFLRHAQDLLAVAYVAYTARTSVELLGPLLLWLLDRRPAVLTAHLLHSAGSISPSLLLQALALAAAAYRPVPRAVRRLCLALGPMSLLLPGPDATPPLLLSLAPQQRGVQVAYATFLLLPSFGALPVLVSLAFGALHETALFYALMVLEQLQLGRDA